MERPFLPYGRQVIEDDDLTAVALALRDDLLTTGPRVEAFETALRGATGAKYAIACNNGTSALYLASRALGLGVGDQVIVPSVTFAATASAPRLAGAEVVLADVDPDSGLLTASALERALDLAPRARAVFPVHLAGTPVDMKRVAVMAAARGLKVVEDACHALGTEVATGDALHRVGDCSFSDCAAFSFHPVKAIAMGEGGAVTTRDPEIAERLRLYRNHGIVREPERLVRGEARAPDGNFNPWYYEVVEPSLNFRVPDLLCALGISQLGKLERFVVARRSLVKRYDAALAPLAPLVRPVPRPAGLRSGHHLYPVLVDLAGAGLSRAEVMGRLRSLGIGSQVHYIPLHRQPAFAAAPERFPGAEAYYARTLSLPLFASMIEADVERVVRGLSEVLGV